MTADHDPTYATRAIQSGAVGFFHKPLDPISLRRILRRLVEALDRNRT